MKTKKPPRELSSTLSVAIRQAVEDLKKCEKDERYVIDMGVWHAAYYSHTGHCGVCLAGAVMAKRLGTDIKRHCTPNETSYNEILRQLDGVRQGRAAKARVYGSKSSQWLRWSSYSDNPAKFKRCLLRIAEMFERRGL